MPWHTRTTPRSASALMMIIHLNVTKCPAYGIIDLLCDEYQLIIINVRMQQLFDL